MNRKEITTFRDVGDYELHNFKQDEPGCINGNVWVTKYRVVVEQIEEPKEVIAERLQRLWETSDNHHHVYPLQAAATRHSVELIGEFGAKRRKL